MFVCHIPVRTQPHHGPLENCPPNAHLRAQTYDRDLADVFAIKRLLIPLPQKWSASLSLQKGVPSRIISGSMQALAEFILGELRSATYCPVYEEQLIRLWPVTQSDREAKIRSFAEERGFRLRFYCRGQCAVFDKQRS
jgi:hypothetical protein